MGWLIFGAVIVAMATHPDPGRHPDANGRYITVPAPVGHHIAWAVVCVAMVAGLVTWAVLR